MKPEARTMDQDVRSLKIGNRAGKPRTKAVESEARTVALAASGAQAVESATLTVIRASWRSRCWDGRMELRR